MISDLYIPRRNFLDSEIYQDVNYNQEIFISDVRRWYAQNLEIDKKKQMQIRELRGAYNEWTVYTSLCTHTKNRRPLEIFTLSDAKGKKVVTKKNLPLRFRSLHLIQNLTDKVLIFDFCSIFEQVSKCYRVEVPPHKTLMIPEIIRERYVLGIPKYLPIETSFAYT
jgi:hypothetical protein